MTRLRHGLVLGKFWPLHAGHQHLIETALADCERVTVQLLAHPDEDIPLEVRAGWIRELYPQAHLVTAYDETLLPDIRLVIGDPLQPPLAWSEVRRAASPASRSSSAVLTRRISIQFLVGRLKKAVSLGTRSSSCARSRFVMRSFPGPIVDINRLRRFRSSSG